MIKFIHRQKIYFYDKIFWNMMMRFMRKISIFKYDEDEKFNGVSEKERILYYKSERKFFNFLKGLRLFTRTFYRNFHVFSEAKNSKISHFLGVTKISTKNEFFYPTFTI